MEGDEAEMREKSEYSLIWVSVASGYSDEVVDAARNAGARGGTAAAVAAGSQGQAHGQSQGQCKDLFHVVACPPFTVDRFIPWMLYIKTGLLQF